MDEIRILQLGEEDWNGKYKLPEGVCLDYVKVFQIQSSKPYDLVFLDRTPLAKEVCMLYKAVKAYTLFVTEKVEIQDRMAWLCQCKKAQRIAQEDIQRFLLEEVKYYFPRPYGEKFKLKDLAVAQGFAGKVKWIGNYCVDIEGEFGEEYQQIAFWRYNSFLPRGQMSDLWLEYDKDPTVVISLKVTNIVRGSASEIQEQWVFNEEDLKEVIRLESNRGGGFFFVSVQAKGRGRLRLIALHKRVSRGTHGYFLPGGERYVTADREELFCYFDPGDLKPPLNVYFSGYKTLQGFEGYNLMRGFGCPFLLVAEPRLEGGCLYVGSEEYEKLVVGILKKYMNELGFLSNQVILSGISGGTYGTLYYGCDIRPHALILGKPVPNLGNVAANEKYLRPGGLPATLDMLKYLCGDIDEAAVKQLNDRFWKKFDRTNWGRSKFIIAYMMEDDYDPDGYGTILNHLQSDGVQVYGKGIHGRHNDNTPAIVNWFVSQYKRVLREDFSRKMGDK